MEIQSQKYMEVLFERGYTAFTERPTSNQRYIVLRNLQPLINQALKESSEFQSSQQNKLRAFSQLQHIVVMAEGAIQQHIEQIFRVLAKSYQNEDGIYTKDIKLIAEIIGVYVDCDIYVPTLIKICQEEELKTSQRLLANYLLLLSCLLKNESDKTLGDNFQTLIHFLQNLESTQSENADLMLASYETVSLLIQISHQNVPIYARQLFGFVLGIQSLPNLPQDYSSRIQSSLEQLAKCCGYTSLSDLHTNEVNVMLDEIVQSKSYEHWKRGGREINKFQVIVQGCKEGVTKFMNQILLIMAHCVAPNQDIELRMDMLILLEYILRIQGIEQTLRLYSYQILTKLLISSMIWKVGKPQIKIRKAAVIDAILLFENKLITGKEVNECFQQFVAPLKSCLNDDWAPDLRFAATNLTEKLFSLAKDYVSEDSLREFYPTLLERLDDSQDPIRIEMAHVIGVFFTCPNLRLSPSTLEYMIKAILIHLDDQNDKVQKAIFECLKVGALIDPQRMIQEAEPMVKNFKYPRACEELIKYAREQHQ